MFIVCIVHGQDIIANYYFLTVGVAKTNTLLWLFGSFSLCSLLTEICYNVWYGIYSKYFQAYIGICSRQNIWLYKYWLVLSHTLTMNINAAHHHCFGAHNCTPYTDEQILMRINAFAGYLNLPTWFVEQLPCLPVMSAQMCVIWCKSQLSFWHELFSPLSLIQPKKTRLTVDQFKFFGAPRLQSIHNFVWLQLISQ